MTPRPTSTPLPPTPSVPPTWLEALPGLEIRTMTFPLADGKFAESVVTRIDPARFDLRIHYDPASAQQVSLWRDALGALAVINAGFFHEDYTTSGLIITDGQPSGVSFDTITAAYYEFGGMFTITDGTPNLRYLAATPYVPSEALDYAVQGLPMLIAVSAPIEFTMPPRPARRTAIAIDASGRVLFINVANDAVTLYEFRDWLASDPELAITDALNLDGGPSTGLAFQAGSVYFEQESWSNIPSVIAVYPK